MRRLLAPLVAALLLGGTAATYAVESACPQAVRDVRGANPSPAAVSAAVATSAAKYDVPAAVVKGIAFQESGWQQFRSDGRPLISSDAVCGIGMMQITLGSRTDGVKLAGDYRYNIDEGTEILAQKWLDSVANDPSEPNGYPEDDRDVVENWYAILCRYNGCTGTSPDQAYALPVAKLIADPFHAGVPSAISAHWPPSGFTTPYDADPDYVWPTGFQAQSDDEFHFFDPSTGDLIEVVGAPTHTDTPFPGYGVAYGPGGPNVSCLGCQFWRPAEGYGVAGWAHWTLSESDGDTPNVRVTWTPPRAGTYDVRVSVPELPDVLADATYHLAGATQTVAQNASKGLEVSLGKRTFAAGEGVWLGDGSGIAGLKIAADAMWFTAYTTLSLTPSARTVTYGRSTALTIRLGQSGGTGGVPGRSVRLWKRKVGVLGWTAVGTYTTGSDGRVVVTATPPANTYYKATFASDGVAYGAPDAVTRVDVAPRVSATLSRTTVARGTAVRIPVTVAPNHAGQQVVLQRLVGGVWRDVTSATLSGTSTAAFTTTRYTAGTYYYRVTKAADSDHVAGTSARLTLRVT